MEKWNQSNEERKKKKERMKEEGYKDVPTTHVALCSQTPVSRQTTLESPSKAHPSSHDSVALVLIFVTTTP